MRILKSLFIAILFCFALLSCKKEEKTETSNSNIDSTNSASADTVTKSTDSAAVFIEMIPAHIESQYTTKFAQVALKHPNLIDKFTLDYPNFKELIEKHTNYMYAKFYFIQDSNNSKLNLGVAFSNNDNYKDISSDDKFVLINNTFQSDVNLQKKIKSYQSSLATQTGFNGKPATECILYKIKEINDYFIIKVKSNISRLDLAMIYFCQAKDDNGSEYNRYANKYDRISFAVHAVYSDGSMDEGYDAGDLKP